MQVAVVKVGTAIYQDVSEQEAFKLQLAGTHELVTSVAAYSYIYACYKIEKPFPPGEAIIATEPYWSYKYAIDVLQSRFTLGEPVIIENGVWCYQYMVTFKLELVNGEFQ